MANLLIYIFILTILHSVLFFNNSLGVNVILFTIPLLIFIYYVLKSNKKIKNKKGLLFIIPIVLLSSAYFYYNNIFRLFNIIIIPILYILMYIYVIKPEYQLRRIFVNIMNLLFEPFDCIGKLYRLIRITLSKKIKLSATNKKKIKSILVVIPIVIIVLLLLSSADMMFKSLFSSIHINISIGNIIGRIIVGVIVFTYLGSQINYLLFTYKKEKDEELSKIKVEDYTVKLLLTILNIIYVVFIFIQVRSLLLHNVSKSINYAEYARSGFFQLMFISLINLIILLVSKNSKETKYNKAMSIIMVAFTLLIILTSAYRMYLYESAYGYTLLRLLVYVTLGTEAILLIPTIIYILNSKLKIFNYYMVIIISIYTIINLISFDKVIAYRNVNRYYSTDKIDTEYLENGYTDNVSYLYDLYEKTDDKKIKNDLEKYFSRLYHPNKKRNILEYNYSIESANNTIKDLAKNYSNKIVSKLSK